MKAIQINRYLENARPILHEDVVEVERIVLSHRQFECKCCGLNWREEINAPATVIEDKEVLNRLEEYYPDYELCSDSDCYKHTSDCVYYQPPTYATCACCKIGGYCNHVCKNFMRKGI